jgi:hypothetical protein
MVAELKKVLVVPKTRPVLAQALLEVLDADWKIAGADDARRLACVSTHDDETHVWVFGAKQRQSQLIDAGCRT